MFSIFKNQKKAGFLKGLFSAKNKIKKALDDVKEQLEDHLTSINENTNEIQANYEYVHEVESKINKLTERIDEISMFIGMHPQQRNDSEIPVLTTQEKRVFLVLYAITEEKEHTTYKEIALKLSLPETLVMNYITNLIEKRIPIIKSYSNNEIRLKISSYFKTKQTKTNILRINEDISKQIQLNNYV